MYWTPCIVPCIGISNYAPLMSCWVFVLYFIHTVVVIVTLSFTLYFSSRSSRPSVYIFHYFPVEKVIVPANGAGPLELCYKSKNSFMHCIEFVLTSISRVLFSFYIFSIFILVLCTLFTLHFPLCIEITYANLHFV